MPTSANLSFRAIALTKKLLPASALEKALQEADERGLPLGRHLVETGALTPEVVKQVEGIRARWGRTCSACKGITYLLPKRTEADTPCERCGGALKPAAPAAGKATPPGPAPRPAPAPAPAAAPAPRPRPAPEPPPALLDSDEDAIGPIPERIGEVAVVGVLAEDDAVMVYAGRLGDQPVAVRVLRPERAQRRHLADDFLRANQAAPAAGLEPVDLGVDALGAPYLAVKLPDDGDVVQALLGLAPPPLPSSQTAALASSDTGTMIFARLQQQREKLLKDVAQASRRRDRVVDRFVLLESLAQDAGELWRAFDTERDEVVAVRVFPWEGERLSGALHTALAGAARPRHSAILPLRESGLDDGRLFLSRELLQLEPLGAGSLRAFLRRAILAAQGLAYLHGLGLVHGGIHPGTLAARPDGTPVLLELGVAAARAATGASDIAWRLARSGCTPPESADGREDTMEGDIHALGAVLFRAASAWLPEELLLPGAAAQEPEAERDFLAVVLRCLASDPAERYPTAMDLVKDLERIEQGQLPVASQPKPTAAETSEVKPGSVVSTLSGVFRKFLRRGE